MKSVFAVFLSLICLVSIINGQNTSDLNDGSNQAAKELWEKAIKAKGGREKLHSVRSMVVSSEGKFYKGFKKISIHLEDFYVFPDKSWTWDDQRPSVFGLSMTMYNWEIGKQYSVQFEGEPYNTKDWKQLNRIQKTRIFLA